MTPTKEANELATPAEIQQFRNDWDAAIRDANTPQEKAELNTIFQNASRSYGI